MWNKIQDVYSKTNRWHIILALFLIATSGLLPSRQLGFYCNDPKLSHPYTGDTITWKWLLVTCLCQPLFIMLIFERIYKKELMLENSVRKNYFIIWFREYVYGLLINLVIIMFIKKMVGEPRPHFFDTCRPLEATTCKETEYVSTYKCTESHWISESAKSFPSGHSSLGLHCGLFIAWYLHVRIRKVLNRHQTKMLTLQLTFVMIGLYCALSRISDRRHHWWDVLAGASIGVSTFYYTVKHLCNHFQDPQGSEKEYIEECDELAENNTEIKL